MYNPPHARGGKIATSRRRAPARLATRNLCCPILRFRRDVDVPRSCAEAVAQGHARTGRGLLDLGAAASEERSWKIRLGQLHLLLEVRLPESKAGLEILHCG